MNYDPSVFNVADQEQAKAIILTPEAGMTPEERWEKETAVIEPLLEESLFVCRRVLDYGCGIGRLSKLLTDRQHDVVGVDISPSMRRLAVEYVNSPKFSACSVKELMMSDEPFDAVVCAWVLQHVLELDDVVELIAKKCRPAAPMFLLNRGRCVPAKGGQWVDDGKRVETSLARLFSYERQFTLPKALFAGGEECQLWLLK